MPLAWPRTTVVGRAMSFLTYQFRIRRPHPYWALGIVVLWSISLCVVDTAARLQVRRSMVLVDGPEHCHRYQKPRSADIVARAFPGDPLWVRQAPKRGKDGCYRLENAQGRQGWAPYNAAYLASDGIDVRWRRFLLR